MSNDLPRIKLYFYAQDTDGRVLSDKTYEVWIEQEPIGGVGTRPLYVLKASYGRRNGHQTVEDKGTDELFRLRLDFDALVLAKKKKGYVDFRRDDPGYVARASENADRRARAIGQKKNPDKPAPRSVVRKNR